MRSLVALAGLLVASFPIPAGDNWPEFRGPAGDGRSDGKNLPLTWSETENVRWKTPIHDKGWSSPVVWGNQIWLTTGREDGKELFAVCADRATGRVVHDLKLFAPAEPQFCHPFNSYASPTPAIEEGRVYIHFGAHGTACLDTATGKTLWTRTDLECNHHRGPGSSPVIYQNLLFLIFDGFDKQYVVALDKGTGKTVWQKDRNIRYGTDNGDYKKAYATPRVFTVGGREQLVCPSAAATVAHDPHTGEELWRVYHGGMNESARPVRGHGLIYLTSGHTGQLHAVKEGGAGLLPADAVAWKAIRGVPTRPSLLLVDDLLFLVSDNGIASCLDAKTGKQQWQERLGTGREGEFSASPVYADGHVYAASQNGKTFVFKAGRTFDLVATNSLDAGCMASPAIVGDSIIVRTKTHLYCLGKK